MNKASLELQAFQNRAPQRKETFNNLVASLKTIVKNSPINMAFVKRQRLFFDGSITADQFAYMVKNKIFNKSELR